MGGMLTKEDVQIISDLLDRKMDEKFAKELGPIREDIRLMRNDIAELKQDVSELKADMITVKKDIRKLRKDLNVTISTFDSDICDLKRRTSYLESCEGYSSSN